MINRYIYIVVSLFYSSYASAGLVEFDFSGQFNNEFTLNGESFDSSDSFLVTISYETLMVNNEETYLYPTGSNTLYSFINSAKFTLAFGPNTFESFFFDCSKNTVPDPMTGIIPECIEPLTISVSDNGLAEGDNLLFNAPNMTLNNELLPNEIKIQFSLNFTSWTDLSILTNSKLPLLQPDTDLFSGVSSFSIYSNDGDAMNPSQLSLGGSVHTVRSIKVPEPSTLAIIAFGMIGLVSRRFKKQS
jgi:hypothetical protein